MPAAIYGLRLASRGNVFQPFVRNLTTAQWSIVDADLELIDYRLKFRGANNILSLDNSTIRLERLEGDLTVGPLTIAVAAASENSIREMEGRPGGPIHLNLGAGQSLLLKGCGSTTLPTDDLRCWWSDPSNQVIVGSGGVLALEESYLKVATENATGPVGAFEIRDGGRVELRTAETTLNVDNLTLVNGGTLDLGQATSLDGPTTDGVRRMRLDGAGIVAREGSRATMRAMEVSGTSGIELYNLADVRATNIQLQGSSSTLNITRGGSSSERAVVAVLDQSGTTGSNLETAGGNIYVAAGATLGVGDPTTFGTPQPSSVRLGNLGATPSIIWVDAGAEARVFQNALAFLDGGPNPPILDVYGDFWIEGQFKGVPIDLSRYTIEDTSLAGSGRVLVGLFGTLEAGAGSSNMQRTLEIQPALRLYWGGEVSVQLFPVSGLSNTIEVAGEFRIGEDDPLNLPAGQLNGRPDLRLRLDPGDDAVVPLGTKFVLFDYDPNHPPSGLGRFRSPTIGGNLIPDGFTFQFGLNQYEIRYSDPVYGAANGGNDSVITLTVVSREVLDDSYTVVENGVLNVAAPGVLANDLVFISSGAGLPVVSTPPAYGNVVLGADGAFAYAPNAGFVGADSFEYVVFNGPFMSAPAVVHIDVTAQTSVLALIDRLIADVDGLCQAGELNRGLCNSLHVKLHHARNEFLRGNHVVAAQSMAAFENEVSALRSGGWLTATQAAPLLQLADEIRAAL
jgi:hypothetical protein